MGQPAARVGDMHVCPMVTPGTPPIPHVGGPILPPGGITVLIGGMPAAVVGNMCVCVGPPDSIVKGSLGVFICGMPAARMGDMTAHGGTIVVGFPTVLIGDIGGGGGTTNVSLEQKKFVDNVFNEDDTLKPNVKYKTGEFGYNGETDSLGRVSKVSTDNLQLKDGDRLPHDGDTPGKLKGDHAGHLFGDRFGGSPNLDNLVSQSSKVNLSKFKKIENSWAKAIDEGKTVEAEIIVNYTDNDVRPTSFDIKWKVDGEQFFSKIKNE